MAKAKLVATLLVVLTLTGCTQWGMIRDTAVEQVRNFNDRALADAEFILFQAAPIGALERRYGSNPRLLRAYLEMRRSLSSEDLTVEMLTPVK